MEGGEQNFLESIIKINHEAKLKELLRNLTSVELQLYSDASKEFIKILKSEEGPEFLGAYVHSSSKLVELLQVWDFRKGKPGFVHILDLVAAILKHWKDNLNVDGGLVICRALDKFARSLIEKKMGDLYKELNSKEAKRQNSVLLLLASIVRRNSLLARDLAKVFDFKLAVFNKLSELRLRERKIFEGRRKIYSTRKAFVGFAMSFLEVGNPQFLRGIVQKKEMYSGVLMGLGNDDEETVVYVLSILRDRVLGPKSEVPTSLRSVLFGSVTLKQLASISGRDDFGDAAELAHDVMLLVCTDPVNGLMPDLERQPCPLRGNRKRLLGLMKNLKATEVASHKSLLLAIVKGRPALGSVYLDEFPYNLEDLSSNNWYASICLASDVVSAVTNGLSAGGFDIPHVINIQCVEDILKCIGPRPFTRSVMNKGLLHSDSRVKYGTLKLVLEVLKLVEFLMKAIDLLSCSYSQMIHRWESVKSEIQHGVRMLLPDPQVLWSLLSPRNSYIKNLKSTKKRKAETKTVLGSEHRTNFSKRVKTSAANEEIDILISGVNPSEADFSGDGEVSDSGGEQQLETGDHIVESIKDLWGLSQCSDLKGVDQYVYLKIILDTLQLYYRTMPVAMEGLDLFACFLLKKTLALPTILQQSLLKLLDEHVNQFSTAVTHNRTPPQMYKYLEQFVILLICSPVREIKEQAYNLAKAALLSTGAFDYSTKEICAWFFFIPGYCDNYLCVEEQEVEIIENISLIVVSFLCDSVSTTGNNLYKYLELMKSYIYDSEGGTDLNLEFSPFLICILDKCLRLLSSKSESHPVSSKSLISHYVCNSIKYILDTQVNAGPLSCLIDRVLSEKLENCGSKVDAVEWRPLKGLLHFARDILNEQYYSHYSNAEEVVQLDNSFARTLHNIRDDMRIADSNIALVGLTQKFSFSLMCSRYNELLKNLPSVLVISNNLNKVPFSLLQSILFLESNHLTEISKLWPEMFSAALNIVVQFEEKKEERLCNGDIELMESASCAFACYLRSTPFHVLFPSIVQSTSLHSLEKSGLLKLLFEKVAEMPYDHLVSSLCNVLFWINNTRSCRRVRSLDELKMLSKICFQIVEQLLKKLLIKNRDLVGPGYVKDLPLHFLVEVIEVILSHPAVVSLLNCPLSGDEVLSDLIFGEPLEKLLDSVKQGIHIMDQSLLDLIIMFSEHVFATFEHQIYDQVSRKRISRAFKVMEQKLLLVFKNKFDACIRSGDFKHLVPTFYVLCTLVRCISPFELLDLANWVFSRIGIYSTTLSSERNARFVALHLACCCFDSISAFMDNSLSRSKISGFLGWADETHFNALTFENIFFHALEACNQFELGIADTCLLKAVKVVMMHKDIEYPSSMTLSRVLASAPVDMISNCLHRVNRTKAKLLYHISRMSPWQTSVFGFLFSEIVEKLSLSNTNGTREPCEYSEEELVMLLPTVVLYLESFISKFGGPSCKYYENIILTYVHVLFGGFSRWKIFVSGSVFAIGVDQPLTGSSEYFVNLFSDSLLGKAVLMVQNHLALSEDMSKPKRRLTLFNSVCPSSADDVFDHCFSEAGLHLLKQPVDFVNIVVAKIKLSRILLFSDYSKSCPEMDCEEENLITPRLTSRIEKSRLRFLRTLVNSWIVIIKKPSKYLDYSVNVDGKYLSLERFLEIFVINNILELTLKMRECLIKLDSLPFVEQLVKSFLLYRFGDPVTLTMLRTILTSLFDGKFSCSSIIQLLLSHSQFAQTIQSACQSLLSNQLGLVLTPMQSILRSLVIPQPALDTSDCENNKLTSQPHLSSLELVKFVRVLFRIYVHQRDINSGGDTDINSRELVHLLLSSYGATCTDIDIEIYHLLIEIESNNRLCAGTVAEMDYLWGIAALKVRSDLEQEKHSQSAEPKNMEALAEHRKMRFRENFPVDPKLCAQTVLYFPHDRFFSGENSHELHKDSSVVMHEVNSVTSKLQVYDPFFILRFSVHCLSMSYIEPIEFACVGLLAVTFVSISSPHDDLRKLGYETLAKFKSALEKCEKKEDVSQLRLLLSYLQNGIEVPWQRIPSIIAIFAAEASLVLLDSSHDNYSTISKHLMGSPRVNMMGIPLFQTFLWSSSRTFGSDRLWMLRLLYSGLNTEDDAQTYIRNSVFENLMKCYSSPLSDDDSKGLIIQIIKKAVQLRKAVWSLFQHGVISWLSFLVSSFCGNKCPDQKKITHTQLPMILEVVNDIITPRSIFESLQKNAMEQLSELSSHLYKLLVDDIVPVEEKRIFCNSALQILTLVLKISQKRKVFQPHFTLSEEGLFRLYEAVEACSESRCNSTMVLGLKAVLMNTPPVTILQLGQENLSKFLRWAVMTAIQSTSPVIQPDNGDDRFNSGKSPPEESLLSKLLRWLIASAILGKISCRVHELDKDGSLDKMYPETHHDDSLKKTNLDTFLSLFGCKEQQCGENVGDRCADMLAASIFFLLQKLEFSHGLLPSAVSALCILLLDSFTESDCLASLGVSFQLLCSKIYYPVEANAAWRWSYYQPWRDLSMKVGAEEKLVEIHACERVLMLASNVLQRKSGCCHCLELKDGEKEMLLRVHDWETALIHSSE